MSSIAQPAQLLTHHDIQGFLVTETRIAGGEGLTASQQHRLQQGLRPLREQAAWLMVEELFIDHPSVTGVRVIADEEDACAWVKLRRDEEEDFYDLGQDPEGLDESFQEYLNNMVQDIAMFRAMAAQPLTRETWLTQAAEWLGDEWLAAREAHMMDQTTPIGSTPAPPAPAFEPTGHPMITFKSFHSSERMSEETLAYDTKVFFEGKLLGTCSEHGTGGQGCFHADPKTDRGLVERARAWVTTQHYKEADGSASLNAEGGPMMFTSLEDYCDALAHDIHQRKLLTAQVKRQLKTKTLFTDPARPEGIFQIARPFTPALQVALEAKHPGCVVLNALPLEQVIERFHQDSVRQAMAEKAEYDARQASRSGPKI